MYFGIVHLTSSLMSGGLLEPDPRTRLVWIKKKKKLCLHAQEVVKESCEKSHFFSETVNSVAISVCWVPLFRVYPEGFWVNSKCEYSEHRILSSPGKPSVSFYPLKPILNLYTYFFLVCEYSTLMLLICSYKLHPEGGFSTTCAWPVVLKVSLKKKNPGFAL